MGLAVQAVARARFANRAADRSPIGRRVAPLRARSARASLMTQAGLDLWLLTHRDVKRVARIRRFADFIAETILADRDLFEGRRPGTEP